MGSQQDPKAASLILKFKEAAKAAEEDVYDYSEDEGEYDDDDNEEEEEEEVSGLGLIAGVHERNNGEVVKKKKLVVVSGTSGSAKKRATNVVTGGGGGMAASPCCQVENCGTDLKEAKRYYRRHKVCEVHAKSPLVVVDGIRQRFCQQCSRFHELSEFDEMRRSCRSRLAGHNERRRKLSSDTHREDQGSNQTLSHERERITVTARPGKHIEFH